MISADFAWDVLKIVGAAAVGSFGTMWRLNHEQLDKRLEEAIDIVESMAGLATEYWLLPGSDPEAIKLGALIVGKSRRLGLLISKVLKPYKAFRWVDHGPLVKFRQAATGGAFQVLARRSDKHRAQDTQTAASDLITALRLARKWW